MNPGCHKGSARSVTPARCGWADQWQKNGPAKITKMEFKKCPVCGAFLVERSGKFSKFYGCKNYPKCKYTEKIIIKK